MDKNKEPVQHLRLHYSLKINVSRIGRWRKEDDKTFPTFYHPLLV